MTFLRSGFVAVGLFALAGAAQAQDPASSPVHDKPLSIRTETSTASASVSTSSAELAGSADPLDLDQLSGLTARQGTKNTTVLSDQDLTAVNRGNSINAQTVGSGPISIGPGSFEAFAGVGNFVINSGHNNNLQGALTINVVAPQ